MSTIKTSYYFFLVVIALSLIRQNAWAGQKGAAIDENKVESIIYVSQANGSDANQGETREMAVKTIKKAISLANVKIAEGSGVKILIAPGTYRESLETITTTDALVAPLVIEGESSGKVIISGSDEFAPSAWTNEGGGVYSHEWNYSFGFYDGRFGSNNSRVVLGHRREMLFINGLQYQQQMIEDWKYIPSSEYWSGQGTYEYKSYLGTSILNESSFGVSEKYSGARIGKIFVKVPAGLDFASARIEVAVRDRLLHIKRSNTVVRNIIFEHCAARLENSPLVLGIAGGYEWEDENKLRNCMIDNCESRYNNAGGMTFMGLISCTIKNLYIHNNGDAGVHSWYFDNCLIQDIEIHENTRRWQEGGVLSGGWYNAGWKIGWCSKNNLFQRLYIHNETTMGLWFDGNNLFNEVEDCLFEENLGGIMVEISEGPIEIRNCRFLNNTYTDGFGLLIMQGRHVTVEGCYFEGNNRNIKLDGFKTRVESLPEQYRGDDYQEGNFYTDFLTLRNNTLVNNGKKSLIEVMTGNDYYLPQFNKFYANYLADYNRYWNPDDSVMFMSKSGKVGFDNYISGLNAGRNDKQELNSVWGNPLPGDQIPPSAPKDLSVLNLSSTGFRLVWDPASDQQGLKEYEIFIEGVKVTTARMNRAEISGLNPSTAYEITVKARDLAGNLSVESTPLKVITLANEAEGVPLLEGIRVEPSFFTLQPGQKKKLTVAFLPPSVSNTQLAWTSGNSNIARVDSAGLVTALSEGIASVFVTSQEGNHMVYSTVEVTFATTEKLEAEENFSVANEAGTNAPIGPLAMEGTSGNTILALYDINDEASVNFNIDEPGYYDLALNIRSGYTWQGNTEPLAYISKYSYLLNSVTFMPVHNSTSTQNIDGLFMALVEMKGKKLGAGGHQLSVKALDNWLMVDYLTLKGPVSNLLPSSLLEAEEYSTAFGINNQGQTITNAANGNWIKFNAVDFGFGYDSLFVNASAESDQSGFEIRLDSPAGKSIGIFQLNQTRGENQFVIQAFPLDKNYGIHDVFILFSGNDNQTVYDWFELSKSLADEQNPTSPSSLAAHDVAINSFRLTWEPSTDNLEVAGYEVFLNEELVLSTKSTQAIITGLTGETLYRVMVKARDIAGNYSNQHQVIEVTTLEAVQSPFLGSPIVIPGTVEAENYDLGGEGLAYHDSDPENNSGAYRFDAVDINKDASGGFNVGWTSAGEWLEYTVDVKTEDDYKIGFFVSSPDGGGSVKVFYDGVDKTGAVSLGATGGWSVFKLFYIRDVHLEAGIQVMRFHIVSSGFDIDKISITIMDREAPLAPTNLNASEITATGFKLSWSAAYDNVGIDYYEVYQDGVFLRKTTGILVRLINLTEGQTYNYTIVAYDKDGNASPVSEQLTVVAGQQTSIVPEDLSEISIFPNPAKEFLNIAFAGAGSEIQCELIDLSGNTIWKKRYFSENEQFHVDFDHSLRNGMYILRVTSENKTLMRKIIME
jgi:chitodextrinase